MAEVILDKISATAHIDSVVAREDLKNGQWLTLGLLDADGERRLATKATNEETADVLLVTSFTKYDPNTNFADYVTKAGQTGRGFHMISGDVISVTKDLVVGAKKGDSLTIGDNGLGFKKAENRGIAQIIGEEHQGFYGDVFVIAIR
ncbi:hypothetical protein [Limosilactobacillus reuteri]|uniref:hypothetical protein n=1 Tax=Limosilactobacillus reuteri TaxID=1598 RepID=UPI0021A95264|nr:hypothetical protein [Limosilactobacillus reuteri]MCT3188839.1 hypothetical protein [Limosilactobacillus reuteri]MCT3196810.1 hypothetical protein [Limosilactobacillus reuteri]